MFTDGKELGYEDVKFKIVDNKMPQKPMLALKIYHCKLQIFCDKVRH